MARKKISEFRAKTLLSQVLGISYNGASITSESNVEKEIEKLDASQEYVVKVDQGVKKRGKQGLVKVRIDKGEVGNVIEEFKSRGFGYFIIEEFVPHEAFEEKYFALSRTRDGIEAYYSEKGGVEIEEQEETVKKFIFPYSDNDSDKAQEDFTKMQSSLGLNWKTIQQLITAFEINYFSFLELNPFIVRDSEIIVLDAAVEVDSAAEFFVNSAWTGSDFKDFSKREKTPEERAIDKLSEKSQASFSLTVLNPNGSIFMLLSGGGASIVLADEAHNQGKGAEVANYGEYSGNPNAEETYIYTKNLLSLLLESSSEKKVLIIGGGVANFTDVRITFRGVIQALSEVTEQLRRQGVKVFVRRGGPRQEEGLKMMKEFLEKEGLFGAVHGPELVLTDVMTQALKAL